MTKTDAIRDSFPIFKNNPNLVYLDSGASAQKPKAVIDAMNAVMEKGYANIHRGIYQLSQKVTLQFEEARQSVANFIHSTSVDEIIFVKSMTEGMNMIAATFGEMVVEQGKTILVSEMEHHSNLIPWMMLAQKHKAKLEMIPLLENGDLDLDAFQSMLHSNVALVSVSHVSNVLGTINPIKEISTMVSKLGIPLIVDGAQAVHHMPVNVQDLGCDFYVFTGHKMYGPTGVGVVWGKKQHLNQMPAYHGGGEMVEEVHASGFTIKETPAKFEAGTPNIVGVIGLNAAIDFITSVGFEKIGSKEDQLSKYTEKELSHLDGIKMLGFPKHKVGIFSFVVEGCHVHDVGTLLDQNNVAVRVGFHCAQPLHEKMGFSGSIRASLGIYNHEEDIDLFVTALKKSISMLR